MTRACGLSDRATFIRADALDLPFDDGSFDAVISQNLSMNVPNKEALFASVHRVLRRGGRFSTADHTQGPGGAPVYPVGWASTPAISFLITPESMRRGLQDAGFRVLQWLDGSAEILSLAAAKPSVGPDGNRPPLGLNIVLGNDYPERQANLWRNLQEDRLVYVTALVVKT